MASLPDLRFLDGRLLNHDQRAAAANALVRAADMIRGISVCKTEPVETQDRPAYNTRARKKNQHAPDKQNRDGGHPDTVIGGH